jgi:hypothetical protein
MKPVTTSIEFFSKKELACKGTGIIKLDPRFAEALIELRKAWNKPIIPTSVCRTPAHNSKVGGHPNSLHLTDNPKWKSVGTMAIDCRWAGWSLHEQRTFAQLAWVLGWTVGLNITFCHLDRRIDIGLPQRVFMYGNWDNRFKPESVKS